jgi:membrane protein
MSDESPGGRLKLLVGIVRRTVTNFLDQDGMQWAGAVAFYLALSVPPLLIAASSIAISMVGGEEAKEFVTRTVASFIPVQEGLIERIADETVDGIGPAALFSLVFLLFSGTRIFAALIAAIHVMWEEVEQAGFVRMQVTRGILLLGFGGLFVIAALLDAALNLVGDGLGLDGSWVASLKDELLPLVLMFLALFALLKLIPHKEASWRSALIGAGLGAVGLRIAYHGFGIFLEAFADFETTYGPLAGVGALMTWALVASVAILLAAHLVAVLNRPDTPSGDARHPAGDPESDGPSARRSPGEPGQDG